MSGRNRGGFKYQPSGLAAGLSQISMPRNMAASGSGLMAGLSMFGGGLAAKEEQEQRDAYNANFKDLYGDNPEAAAFAAAGDPEMAYFANKGEQDREARNSSLLAPKGEFGYLIEGLDIPLEEKQRLMQERAYTLSKNPDALFAQRYATESAKNAIGQEQQDAETNKNSQTLQGQIQTVKDILGGNPEVVGKWAAMKSSARDWGLPIGFNSEEARTRGDLVRTMGEIQNSILAKARASGQTGINTMAEIRQATKGLDENSSSENIMGALEALERADRKLSEAVSSMGNSSQMPRTQSRQPSQTAEEDPLGIR